MYMLGCIGTALFKHLDEYLGIFFSVGKKYACVAQSLF